MARQDGIKWYPTPDQEKVKRPKSIVDEPSCRYSRGGVWATGRHGLKWFYCDYWHCDNCKRRFIAEMCTKILALSEGAEFLYTFRAVAKQKEAAKKQAQNAKAARLTLALGDLGAFIVSDRPFSGRGWATEEHKNEEEFVRIDLPMRMYGLEINRRNWGGAWKVEQLPNTPRDRLLHLSPRNLYKTKQEWNAAIEAAGGKGSVNLANAEEIAARLKDREDAMFSERFGEAA